MTWRRAEILVCIGMAVGGCDQNKYPIFPVPTKQAATGDTGGIVLIDNKAKSVRTLGAPTLDKRGIRT